MFGKASGEYMVICDVGARGCHGQFWTAQTQKRAAEKAAEQAGWTATTCPNCAKQAQP